METENRKIMKKIFSVFVFASILMLSQTLFAQTVKVDADEQNYTIVSKEASVTGTANIFVEGEGWNVTSIVDATGSINSTSAAYKGSGTGVVGDKLILPYNENTTDNVREATITIAFAGGTIKTFTFIQVGLKPAITKIEVTDGNYAIGDVLDVTVTFSVPITERVVGEDVGFTLDFANGGIAKFMNTTNIVNTDKVVLQYTVIEPDLYTASLKLDKAFNTGVTIDADAVNSLVDAAHTTSDVYNTFAGDVTGNAAIIYADLPEILTAAPTALTNAASGNSLTITASNFANRIFLVKEGTSISSVNDLITSAATYSATYSGTAITMAANNLPVSNKPTQNYTLYAVDIVNNISSAYLTPIVVSDVIAPTAGITYTGAVPANGMFDVNVAFSEVIPVFNSGDINVMPSNFSIAGFDLTNMNGGVVTVNAGSYTGIVTVNIPAGVIEDAAGNKNVAESFCYVNFDATGAVPTITTVKNPTNASSMTVNIEFDMVVAGFDASDINVSNATKGAFTPVPGGKIYDLVVTPDVIPGAYTIRIDVVNNSASSIPGNGGIIGGTYNLHYDAISSSPSVTTSYTNVTPSIDIPTGRLSSDAPVVVTVTYPEYVNGFDISKVTVNNAINPQNLAMVSRDASKTVFTFNVTPSIPIDFGEVTISIGANCSSDRAGNWSAKSTDWKYTYLGAPVLVKLYEIDPIDITPDPNAYSPSNNDIVVKIDFYRDMENVANFKQSDVTVTFTPDAGAPNVVTTNNFFALESPASTQFGTERFIYSFNVDQTAPATQGNFTFKVAENKLFDVVGNANTTSNTLTVRYDAIGAIPTVTTVPDIVRANTAFAVTVDFGEAVTGFDENMLVSSLGTPGKASPVSVSTGKYTIMVTPTVDGTYVFSVPTNANLKDVYGNLTQSSTVNETVIWDTTNPVPTVTSAHIPFIRQTNMSNDPIAIEVNYGEPILAGFTTSSAAISISTLSGAVTYNAATDFSYFASDAATGMVSFNITPVGQGVITVSVPANTGSDLATNKNVVSAAAYTIVVDNKAPTPVITVPTIPHGGFGNLSINPVPVTVTFDEAVAQIGSHGLHVGNGVADGAIQMVMVSANVYSFNLDVSTTNSYSTASSANLTILTVNVGNFQDAALNDCLPALYSFTFDGLQPIPTIIPMNVGFNTLTNLTTISTKIVFNNGIMGFTPATPVVSSNAIKGGYTANGPTFDTFTLDLSPVNVASGNELITMTIPANVSGVGGSYPFTATNISIGNPATASSIYSITSDRRLMPGSVYSFTYDGAGPVCTSIVTDVPDNSDVQLIGSNYYVKGGTSTLSIAIDFTDDHKIDAFDVNDVTITADAGSTATVGGVTVKTAGTPGSTFYGVIVELTSVAGDGAFTVDLLAGATTDEVGNQSLAYTTPWKFVLDNAGPIPTITVDNPVITEGALMGIDNIADNNIFVNVDFGEAMTSFNSTDLSVTFGGTISTATNVILDNVNGLYRFELDLATAPLPSHIVAIWVADNQVQDGSGNDNSTNAASYFSFSYDPVAPIPTISNYYGAPIFSFNVTTTSPIIIKVDFGENIGGFTTSDLTTFTATPFLGINSNSLSNPVSIGGGIYSFSITPVLIPALNRVTYSIGMGANMATDGNGNYNLASNVFQFTYDNLAAIPTITSPEVAFEGLIGNNVDNTIAIEIDFGTQMLESSFTTADISVSSNGNAGPFYLSSLGAVNTVGLYSFNIDPTVAEATATVELWIENPVITGNSGLACLDDWRVMTGLGHFSFNYDGVRPVPTIYSLAVPFGATNILSVPMTVEFSKTVSTPSITDFTFSPGVTPSGVTKVSGTNYVFDLVIDATTTLVTIGIKDAVVKDALNNTSTTASFSFVFDGLRPHPTITAKRAGANYPNGTMTKVDEDVFEITVDFGEQMFGNNAFLSTEVVARYTGTMSASSVTYDNWTSHDEIGIYTFTTTIAKDLDGTIVFDIAENVTSDGATNQNYALTYAPFGQTTFTIVHDGVEPMPTISSTYPMDGIYRTSTIKEDPVVLTVDFGEEVNFMNMNVLLDKGSVLAPTSPTGWLTGSVFTITCDVPAFYEMKAIDFEMYVASGMVTDKAGNYNSDSRWNGMGYYTVVYDGNVPVPTITTVAGNGLDIINSEPTPFTVEFNRPVNEANFIASTINQNIKTGDLSGLNFTLGATKSISSSVTPGFAAIYTFDLDIPGSLLEGTYTLDIPADVTSSVAGKYNNVSSQYTFVFDNKGPMPVISTPNAGSNWVSTTTTQITVAFDEEMQAGEFTLADISTNAPFSSAWTANDGTNGFDGNAIYSFTVTLTAPFTTIGIDAGVAHDVAGNANSAYSPTYSIFYDNVPLEINANLLKPTLLEQPEAGIFTYNVLETTVGSGVASVTVTCTGNGATNTQTLTYPKELQTTPTFSDALSVLNSTIFNATWEGSAKIDISATDHAGNTTTNPTINFTYDGLHNTPTVTCIYDPGPVDGQVPLKVNFGDIMKKINSSMITFTPSNPTATITSSFVSYVGNTLSFNLDVTKPEPTTMFTITVGVPANTGTDRAGNPTEAATYSINYLKGVLTPSIYPTIAGKNVVDPWKTKTMYTNMTIEHGLPIYPIASRNLLASDIDISRALNNGKFKFGVAPQYPGLTIYTFTVNVLPEYEFTEFPIELEINPATYTYVGGITNRAAYYSFMYDGISPTPVISAINPETGLVGPSGFETNNSVVITVDYGEVVNTFVQSHITLSSAAVGTNGFGATGVVGQYTMNLTPPTYNVEPLTISIGNGLVYDVNGNANSAAKPYEINFDVTAPIPTVVSNIDMSLPGKSKAGKSDKAFDIIVTFGEEMKYVDNKDFDLNVNVGGITYNMPHILDAELIGNGGGNTYGIYSFHLPTTTWKDFAPKPITSFGSEHGNSLQVTAGQGIPDLAGNSTPPSLASLGTYSVEFDMERPEPTIRALNVKYDAYDNRLLSAPLIFEINFEEYVTDFDLSDITATPANANLFSTANFTPTNLAKGIFTFEFVPDLANACVNASNLYDFQLNAGAAYDMGGNWNTNSPTYSFLYDACTPKATVEFCGVAEGAELRLIGPTNKPQIPVKITFSELITGFTSEDINIQNLGYVDGPVLVSATNVIPVVYTFNLYPIDVIVELDLIHKGIKDLAGNVLDDDSKYHKLTVIYEGENPIPVFAPVNANETEMNLLYATSDNMVEFTIEISEETNFSAAKPVVATNKAGVTLSVTYSERLIETPKPDGKSYYAGTFSVTMDATNEIIISIPADTFEDLVSDNPGDSNPNDAYPVDKLGTASAYTIYFDNTDPKPVITTIDSRNLYKRREVIGINVDFGEVVKDLSYNDVKLASTEGTKAAWSAMGGYEQVYTFNTIPQIDYDDVITITIPANVVKDYAGRSNVAGVLTFTYDGIVPTPSLSTTNKPVNGNPIVTVTFDEVVTPFNGDVTSMFTDLPGLPSGSIANVAATTTEGVYEVTIAGLDGELEFDLTMNADVVADDAGNLNPESNTVHVMFDNTDPIPTLTATVVEDSRTNVASVTVTVNYGEAVDVTPAITVVGAAATPSTVTGDVATGRFNITLALAGNVEQTITTSVAAAAVSDLAGNESSAGEFVFIYDKEAPTATISSIVVDPMASNNAVAPIELVIDFSEMIYGTIDASKFAVSNCEILSTIDATSGLDQVKVTVQPITPQFDGIIEVQLNDGAVADAMDASNASIASNNFTFDYDNIIPIPTITVENMVSGDFTKEEILYITVTFGEPVNGFELADNTVSDINLGVAYDIQIIDPTIGQFKYALTSIDSDGNGSNELNVVVDAATDEAGNKSVVSNTFVINVDNTNPIPSVTSAQVVDGFANGEVTLDISWIESNQPIASFTAINVNGVKTNLTTPTTLVIPEPTADKEYTISIPYGAAKDQAGNSSDALTSNFTFTIDVTAPLPTVIVEGFTSGVVELEDADVVDGVLAITVEFGDEMIPVTDFTALTQQIVKFTDTHEDDLGDATVVPGTLVWSNGNSTLTYQVEIADALYAAKVATNQFVDVAGNVNIKASNRVGIEVFETAPKPVITFADGASTSDNSPTITVTWTNERNGKEDVSASFDPATDLILGNAIITNQDSDLAHEGIYEFALKLADGALEGDLTVDIAANVCSDAYGNGNLALVPTFKLSIDSVIPMPKITVVDMDGVNVVDGATVTDKVSVRVDFGEYVQAGQGSGLFDVNEDVVLTPVGEAYIIKIDETNSANGVYEFELQPSDANSFVNFEILVPANVSTDNVGNDNLEANFEFTFDGAPPVPVITADEVVNEGSVDDANTIHFNVEFTEEVSELTDDMVTVKTLDGTVIEIDNWISNSGEYTFAITPPVTDVEIGVSIAMDVVTDVNSVGNEAGEFTFYFEAIIVDPIIQIETQELSNSSTELIPAQSSDNTGTVYVIAAEEVLPAEYMTIEALEAIIAKTEVQGSQNEVYHLGAKDVDGLEDDGTAGISPTRLRAGIYYAYSATNTGLVSAVSLNPITIREGIRPIAMFDAVGTGSSVDFISKSMNVVEHSWNFGDGTPDQMGQNAMAHKYESVGTYTVILTVTGENSEVVTAEEIVEISIDVIDIDSELNISVYPNPSNGLFNVDYNSNGSISDAVLKIMDVSGRLIKVDQFDVNDKTFNRSYDISNYNVGTYFIQLETENGIQTKTVILQK